MSASPHGRILMVVLVCLVAVGTAGAFAAEPAAPASPPPAEGAAPAPSPAPPSEAAPAEPAETAPQAPAAAESAPTGPPAPAARPSAGSPVTPAGLTVPLTVQWIKSMGAEPGNIMPPLVLGDRLFITHGGSLYCFDPVTGAQYWQVTVKGANISSAPIAWKGTVIVGVDSGLLLALRPEDGKAAWSTDCGGYIAATPAIINGVLVVGSEQTVLGLNPDNGRTKWATTLTSGALDGPLTDGTAIYFRCLDGSVQSLESSNGRYRWRVPAPTGPESYPPLMVDRRVLLVEGSWLYAISRTGGAAWSQQMPAGIGGPVTLQEGKLYVPCVDGHLYVLNPRSGRVQQRGPEYAVTGSVTASPVVTDTLVFLGTSSSLLYALDRATGAVRWVYRCRAPEQPIDEASVMGIYAPLVLANGRLVALSGTGDLYCFGADAPDAAGPTFAVPKPAPGDALPDGSLTVSVEVFDDGCGVAADSLAATADGRPLRLSFDAASGMVRAGLPKPEDGIHLIKVSAADYRGNQATREWSFLTDKSLAPKEVTATTPGGQPAAGRPAQGRGRGSGGPGGGGPGGGMMGPGGPGG